MELNVFNDDMRAFFLKLHIELETTVPHSDFRNEENTVKVDFSYK